MAFQYKHGDRPLAGYTVLRGIGRGGFGEVYYAVSDGGREVALKCVQQNSEIELRGVRQCMNLKSPHLVSIFDVRMSDTGVPFVIMEHVKGPSLRDVIRAYPNGMAIEKAAFFAREIAKGLGYLHEQGIVHRDLKPENIFFEDGYVKIGDYGLSKFISVSRQSGHTISVGTVHYMAPEIGSGNYQRSIDVYALGVMLFELLTGTVPFNGDSMGEILMKHISCEPELGMIPPALRPVVAKALAKKPEERYSTVEELARDVLERTGVAAAVDALDPSCFASVGRPGHNGGDGGAVPAAGARWSPTDVPTLAVAESPGKAGGEAPPRPALGAAPTVRPAPPPRGYAPAAPAAATRWSLWGALRGTFQQMFGEGREAQKHLFLGLGAAVVLGIGIGIATDADRKMDGAPVSIAAIILAAALPILFVERWAAPRWRLEKGFQRGLTHVAFGGPFYAPFCLAADSAGTIAAITATLLLVDWGERTDPGREDAVDIGQALLAGIVGLVVSAIVHGDALIIDAAIAASISLVVNAMAPFAGRAWNKKAAKAERRAESVSAALAERAEAARRAAAPAPVANRAGGPPPLAAFPVAAAAPAVAPAPGATAPRPPGTADQPIRRLMRSEDHMLGGVCGGIAERYRFDPTLLRVFFFLTILFTFGYAMIAYFVLWVFMPAPPTAAAAGASAAPLSAPRARTREVSAFSRIIHQILGSLCGLGALGCATATVVGLNHPQSLRSDEALALFMVAIALGFLSVLGFWKGTLRERVGAWRGTMQPFLVGAAGVTAVGAGLALVLLGSHRPDERLLALAVTLVCSAAVFLVLGAHWLRWLRRLRRRGRELPPRPPVSRAWVALGMLLMILAAMTFVATTIFCMRLGPGMGLGAGEGPLGAFDGFFPGHRPRFAPLLATLLFFVPGLLALLFARRAGGLLHILRGAVGWLVAAVFCAMTAVVLIERASIWQDVPSFEFAGSAEFILVIVLLAAVATLCLAWPSSRRSTA